MTELKGIFAELAKQKLDYFTIIVDPIRSPTALADKENNAIGV